ncbi:MAG TPA: ArsR family transcriptional regulator [Rhizobiales bacterium]|nr:ArsR family transcriptional regulator [Hyphomicrobiales bacterium]
MHATSLDFKEIKDVLQSSVKKNRISGQAGSNDPLVEQARSASSQLKAMAHESRLAILFHLYEGAKSVSQLEALLDMRQPAVSQQLARLRSDQMVTTERRGKQVYYSISSKHAFVIVELLHRLYGNQVEQ